MSVGDEWWEKALCKDMDLQPWYASGPGKKALAVCAQCPVVEPCRAEAFKAELENGGGNAYGVRGGLTAPQRKRIMKQMRRDTKSDGGSKNISRVTPL